MEYKNYDIRLANSEEINSALYLALEIYMSDCSAKYGQKGLDELINRYYLNPDYINAAQNGEIPFMLAFYKKEMIGLIAPSQDLESIALIYVKNKFQRQGIGRALFHSLEEYYSANYQQISSIKVDGNYCPDFFAKIGFEEQAYQIRHPLPVEIVGCSMELVEAKSNLFYQWCLETQKPFYPNNYFASANLKDFYNQSVLTKDNTLLAILENKIVGFVTYANCNSADYSLTGEIKAIYVDPKYYRNGIGKLLLNRAIATIPYKTVIVKVPLLNTIALHFFDGAGFINEKEITEEEGEYKYTISILSYQKRTCKLSPLEAINVRRSIRNFNDKPLDEDEIIAINDYIKILNNESHLNFQLIVDNPEIFQCGLNHYGVFNNVKYYIAVMGTKDSKLEEKCGYYGERLVIHATSIGLGTCWVGLTYNPKACRFEIPKDNKLVAVIAIGHYDELPDSHTSKPIESFYKVFAGNCPSWFLEGVSAAMLAPTAMNQQKFFFTLLDNGKVKLEVGTGVFTKIDFGILKYHFEVGTNGYRFLWKL